MKKRNTFIALTVLTASMLLSGCDKIVLVPGQSSGKIPEQSEVTVSNDFNEYPVTLNGTEITSSPKTVISLTPAYTEILFEMGYGDKLIAVSDYCDYPPETEKLPKVSGSTSPDIDKIIELKPELLITGTPIVAKDQAALESHGIKIITVLSPSSMEQFENIYTLFGAAFEGTFTGKEKGQQSFAKIKQSAAAAQKSKQIKFAYITASLSPAGGNTFESAVLSLFGENCAKSGIGYAFPAEELMENQPDVIFLNDEYTLDDLKDNEAYAALDAVKNGKVITINNRYFERPSARLTELIDSIVKELPEYVPAESEPAETTKESDTVSAPKESKDEPESEENSGAEEE